MNKKNLFKIAFYIRVSTEEQAENPEGSIKNQEERLHLAVKYRNQDQPFGEVVGVYIDRAKSGKDTNRPELQRLLTAIRKGEVNYVLVSELSRISRNMRDFAEIWEMMKKLGCGFQSLRENFDTTTAAGEMVIYTMANMAQFERRQVSERVAANINIRASRGLYNGGTVPLGYKLDPEKPGTLCVDPEMAGVVKEAFQTFMREGTLSHTAKSLNKRGYKLKRAKQGGGRFSRLDFFTVDNLQKILRNYTYVAQKPFKAKEGVKYAKAVWEPIVDLEVFEDVQKILTANKSHKKAHTQRRYPYILSSLTVCGKCGDAMVGKSAHGKCSKIGYYEHGWATKRDSCLTEKLFKCDPHRVRATKLEPLVWNEVKKLILDKNFACALLKEAQEDHKKNSTKREKDQLRAKIYGWNSQLEALAERLAELPKNVSASLIYVQMEKLEKLKSEALSKIGELDRTTGVVDTPVDWSTYEKYLAQLKRFVEADVTPEVQSRLIAKLVSKILIFNDRVIVRFGVCNEFYERELEVISSQPSDPTKTEPQIKIAGGSDFFSSGCSNSLTVGAP